MTNLENTNRTFGVEIECIIPSSTFTNTRGNRSTIISNFATLLTNRTGLEFTYGGYHSSNHNTWHVEYDSSVHGNGYGFEIVGPVLTINQLDQVRKVTNALEGLNATVNRNCGLHVHIGTSDLTFKQKKLIAKRYLKFEDVFDYFMPVSRRTRNNQYCNSMWGNTTDGSANAINRQLKSIDRCRTLSCVSNVFYNGRYSKVNFQTRKPTVEFRHHSGTTDFAKISNWVLLCMSIVNAAKNGKPIKKMDSNRFGTRPLGHRFSVLFNGLDVDSTVKTFFRKRMKHFIKLDGQPESVGA